MKKIIWSLGYSLLLICSAFIIVYAFIESLFVKDADFGNLAEERKAQSVSGSRTSGSLEMESMESAMLETSI